MADAPSAAPNINGLALLIGWVPDNGAENGGRSVHGPPESEEDRRAKRAAGHCKPTTPGASALYPSANWSRNSAGGSNVADQVFAKAPVRANDNSRAARPFTPALPENIQSVTID